ncbi:uncharacterized protein LOC8065188 [Sorghum bicolor]|uniref:Uncharacterized protein n=1 Tax=Sorghum bicolor TaxID=4558 RepID=A0A1Z5S6G9_SORBI|nr:uncharacterized protein LOC8065188 [Sorghum bicolor]OQU91531.1 hypothetical protein SORBI_3001G199632 [Sorghum bicolor]|eukprot:XP_002464402.2 uncharacterized protein LOC8065188 [Sorghum bicolor]
MAFALASPCHRSRIPSTPSSHHLAIQILMCQPDTRETFWSPSLHLTLHQLTANIYMPTPHCSPLAHRTLELLVIATFATVPMASRCGSLSSLPWLLLLVLVLGDAAAATAMPRPLLGMAEPPATAPGTAVGPAGASRPRGGGRPDRDRSVAGAEVILAGFAAAVMVTIFCYIRATRKNSGGSSSSSDVGVGLGSGGKQQRGL